MTIVVVGYGLIGKERVKALHDLHKQGFPIEQVLVLDPQAFQAGIPALPDIAAPVSGLEQALSSDPTLVIIATPHDTAVTLLHEILQSSIRVLVEKPMGRNLAEASAIASQVTSDDQLLVGFNYRFFPGIRQAIRDAVSGQFGDIINVSMVLGHGGAPDMERGWKFDPVRAGGGCLIDPGIHLLDLCSLLAPEAIRPIGGNSWSGFWKTGIEEEVHLLLKSGEVTFNLQVSVVRWRSVFRMEIHGTEGYGIVTGRGRSYGRQVYLRGKRWGWQNAPSQAESEETVVDSDANDSFRDELAAILGGDLGSPPASSAASALEVMRLYEACHSHLGLQ